MTTFIVQLSGNPVTVADANSKDAGNGALSPGPEERADGTSSRRRRRRSSSRRRRSAARSSRRSSPSTTASRCRSRRTRPASLESITGRHERLPVAQPLDLEHSRRAARPGAADLGRTPGFTGVGMKIADIDTGIDYTHADFGGPGTVAAWNTALSQSTADPTLPTVCQTATLDALLRAERAEGQGRHRPRRRRLRRGRHGCAADPAPGSEPARLQRARHAHRRHRCRRRRAGQRAHVHRSVQRDHRLRQQLERRSRRRAAGLHLRDPRLRLQRLGERRRADPGDGVGGRQPHGRHQHVARRSVRHGRRARTRRPRRTRRRTASSSSPRRATTGRRRTSRARREQVPARSRWRRAIRPRTSRGRLSPRARAARSRRSTPTASRSRARTPTTSR